MDIYKNYQNKVHIIGHKNPDTDSICSAIAYAHLKNQISEAEHIPRSAGLLNEETHYVLDRFGVDTPKLLSNSYLKVRDVDVNTIPGISSNTSIKEAWATMKEQNVYTIAVTKDDELEGVISTGDIATSYMDVYDNEILSNARTQYQNIVNTLDGEIITGNPHAHFVKGKVVVAASSPDLMEKIIGNDDLVILGNRYEVQLCAIELNVSCIIVCLNASISKTIQKLAEERDIVVISTPHDAFTAARLINQSIPVKYFMNSKENLTVFNTKDNVEEIKGIITSKRTRDFPVLDDNGKYYGFISSRRLMEASKRKVILVDHNEKTQAVDGIEQADILEIIDHHRLGGIETLGPVYFRNQPVGCTATIVYSLYKENNIVPDKTIASLLCAAIISDTLFFRSPTCTLVDEYTAKELAEIADLDLKELAANMFKAGSDLRGKSAEEICYQDFKQFAAGEVKFGVGQVNCMSREEIEELKAVMVPYLEQVAKKQKLDMVFFMLTNVMEVGTELLCCGKNAKELALQAFKLPENTDNIYLQDVVSRKKQLIPAFVVSLQR
ncbi:MAG: putative manganese-dependent inorganic diphosphatase [Lachnospiraceae bacterium]|nr:putative manganese-dependent inorganic diphosphatase [Lachnospiraceae bacterium]